MADDSVLDPSPTGDLVRREDLEALKAELESKLMEQEHRVVPALMNVAKTFNAPKADPRRWGALRALLWRIFSRTPQLVVLGGTGLLVGVLTLIVAVAANRLLQLQNQQIATNNQLLEAQRRAGLMFELTSILEELTRLRNKSNDDEPQIRALPSLLLARIQALAGSLRPYRYLQSEIPSAAEPPTGLISHAWRSVWPDVEPDMLIGRALSPERGQLLVTLTKAVASVPWDTVPLEAADATRASLTGSDLTDALLSGADLSRADLSNARLTYADLRDATLSHANLSGATLYRADLSGADLAGVVALSAQFHDTVLSGVNLREADLSHADLTGAHLGNADLRGARLIHANLMGADITGADLATAHGLTAQMIEAACAQPDTPPRLPKGLRSDLEPCPSSWTGP